VKRLLFCLTFLLHLSSQAQENTWPPDLESALGADVEIVSVETVVNTPTPNHNPRFDNTLHEFSVYDYSIGEMITVPYPDEIESLVGIEQESQVVTLKVGYELSTHWRFDISTDEFWQVELMCGEYREETGDGYWLIPLNAEVPYLCNTETGETLPLPADAEGLYNSYTTLGLSPDGSRGVLIGNDGFYVYSFADASLINLGGTTYYDIQNVWWMGNDLIMVMQTEMGDMSFPWRNYYLADANEAGSLHWITTALKPGYITRLENPARLEWVESQDGACFLVQLHYETGQRDEYPLETVCEQGYTIGTSDERLAYPLILEEIESDCEDCQQYFHALGRRLVRFNPYTGEEVELMSGEIEFVMDITDDGRYAIIVLDDNGQIDMLDEWERQNIFSGEVPFMGQLRYAVIELQTGQILYEVPTAAASYFDYWYDGIDEGRIIPDYHFLPSLAVAPNDSFYYIGEDRFIFSQRNPDFSTDQKLIRLYPSIEEIELGQPILVLPDNQGLIQKVQNNENYQLEIFNPETGRRQVMLNIVDANLYNDDWLSLNGQRFRISRGNEADTIEVYFYNQELNEGMRYFLRIPSLS
jgi:hypothetical protein